MLKWQKRARLGIAVFGIVCAIVVYAAIGERRTSTPAERPSRLDERSILESTGAAFQQFRAARQEYVIEAERQLTYEGGATKFIGVTIRVAQRAGRDFVVSGREAQAGDNHTDMEITGDVRLAASDGFVAMTDRATFSETDATVRVAGAVSFRKGRMSGSGVGMTYDQNTDVLTLAEQARVTVTDEAGRTEAEFTSTSATLARLQDYLALEGSVHVLRGNEVLDANRGRALLSEDDDVITFIELRGDARVLGGEAFDSIAARDIDLDYSESGDVLERVVLSGDGSIAMPGEEGAGRQFAGDSLELAFAPDASVTRATGRGNVRVDLPEGGSAVARVIRAQSFDASGEAGRGLTAARFDDQVEYREDGSAGRAPRVARAGSLQTTLSEDGVTAAVFTARVTFEVEGLRAGAARVEYDPAGGGLHLQGTDAGGGPRVSDGDIEIDADAIDVTLEGPRMVATGSVRTLLHPLHPRSGAADAGAQSASTGGRLPGLLRQGQAANISANALDYQGGAGMAAYSGNATLWQGETAIRAEAISLDQRRADLIASGNARSNLALDTGVSVGRAPEIRYEDAARRIVFGPGPPRPVVPALPAAPARTEAPQLSGPQGDLRAGRIEVVLAAEAPRIERLEAYGAANVRLDTRVASGDRLTYFAQDERYVMTGVATVPVKIVEECRETVGRTVTFFRSTERIIVDGNEEVRTRSSRSGPCPAPSAP